MTCLSVGCGCPSGTTTASVIAFLSASATFLSVAGSTLTGTSPAVTVGVDLSASVWCTASIAFLPSSVAFATSSGVVALSIFASWAFLTLSTSAFLSVFCWSVKFLSASISAFSLLAASVKSDFACSFALSNSVLCTASIAFLPSSVAFATSSVVPALSIFASWAFLTLSTSAFLSAFCWSVKFLSASISAFSLLAASVKSAFACSFALSNSVWCTASIAFLPASVAFATSSVVCALSIFSSWAFLTLSTSAFLSAFCWSVKFLSASISAFSLLAASVKSAFACSFALSNSVLCTASIAFLPSSVAFATSSVVPALSIFASWAFLTLSTSAFLSAFCWSVKFLSASISAFSLLATSVKSAFAFSLALSNDFSASVFASTVLDAGSSFCDLSEYVTVTFPVLSTEIWLSVKFVFAFLTAALTAAFSSSDKLDTSLTFTFSGSFSGDFAASVPSTGTSTVLVIPSWVTVTGTTFLSPFSAIAPYSTT